MSEYKTCANCHQTFENYFGVTHGEYVEGFWYCWDCARGMRKQIERRNKELQEREREKEREREEKRQQEFREQEAKRRERERMAEEEYISTCRWLHCSNCGESVREDKAYEVREEGDKTYCLCDRCGKKRDFCDCCDQIYFPDHPCLQYKRDDSFIKTKDNVEYNEYVYTKDSKHYHKGNISCTQYDNIECWHRYLCPDCERRSRENDKSIWEESKKLEIEYNRLKSTKERQDREKKERQEKNEKERQENTLHTFSGICFGLVLLVACLVIGYMSDQMTTAAIVGILLCIVSYLLRSITSSLFMGLIYGICIGLAFGLPIAIASWFVWDTFLMPLIIVALIGMVVGTILDKMGVFDSKS